LQKNQMTGKSSNSSSAALYFYATLD
jgi:hypothetical protein